MGIWLLVMFIFPMFSKRDNKKRPQAEQDRAPQNTPPRDIAEEERKLKEWLENVFGKSEDPAQSQADGEYYEEETSAQYERPPALEPRPAYIQGFDLGQVEYSLDASSAEPEIAPQRWENPWRGRIGKNQMAYGMVMAEVFAKPRAFRPIEHVCLYGRKHTST